MSYKRTEMSYKRTERHSRRKWTARHSRRIKIGYAGATIC